MDEKSITCCSVDNEKKIATREIRISEFNIPNTGASSILIIGKRGSGKSSLIRNILKKMAYNKAIVFSPSSNELVPYSIKRNIEYYDQYDAKVIESAIEQSHILARTSSQILRNKPPNRVFVFDNLPEQLNGSFFRNKEINKLILNGRHYGASCIITNVNIQIPPIIRQNMDYVFILRNENRTIKRIYDEYQNHNLSYVNFLEIHGTITNKTRSNFTVFDNTKPNGNNIYYYRLSMDFIWKRFHHKLKIRNIIMKSAICSDVATMIMSHL